MQNNTDPVNNVQRHSSGNSAYCLGVERNGTQYCRIHYPFDENPVTYIKYNQVSNIAGLNFIPKNVAKRNDL